MPIKGWIERIHECGNHHWVRAEPEEGDGYVCYWCGALAVNVPGRGGQTIKALVVELPKREERDEAGI